MQQLKQKADAGQGLPSQKEVLDNSPGDILFDQKPRHNIVERQVKHKHFHSS